LQVIEEIHSLISILPGASNVERTNLDLLSVFYTYVINETFQPSNLTIVRETMLLLITSLAQIVKNDVDERNQVMSRLENEAEAAYRDSITSLEKEVGRFRGKLVVGPEREERNGLLERRTLELEVKLKDKEVLVDKLLEVNEEVMLRLKRMLNHVSRVEIEMEQMEAKHDDEKRRLSNVSPAMMKSGVLINASGSISEEGFALIDKSAVSVEDYQALIVEKEELNKEIESIKMISQSRLIEIEELRSEKVDILRRSSLLTSSVAISGELRSEFVIKSVEEENRLLKDELNRKIERMERIMKEMKEMSDAFHEAKKNLEDSTKTQLDDSRLKLERMTVKLKGMEGEKDKANHLLAISKSNNQESLSHLPQFQFLEHALAATRTKLEKSIKECDELKIKISKFESSPDSQSQLIIKLEAEIKNEKLMIEKLKSEILKGDWLEEKKREDIFNSISKFAILEKSLDEAKKREEDNAILLSTMEEALSEVSAQGERMAKDIDEKERRLASLLKDRVNGSSLIGVNKRMSSIDTAMIGSDKSRGSMVEKMLLAEKKINSQYKSENDRLKSEIEKMRKMIEEYESVTVKTVIAMDILKKKCEKLESQLKGQEDMVTETKVAMEEEKGRSARVEEQLSLMKMRDSMRSSSSSSLLLTPNNEEESKRRNQSSSSDLYRTFLMCSICNQRQVDCTIVKCGHVFCKVCIENKCLKPRNRKCPKCKVQFGANDILNIFF
jgi:chromosome segregation ATPase